jgi:hypothetical protein
MDATQQTVISVAIATVPTMIVVLVGILVNWKITDYLRDRILAEIRRVEDSLLHKFAELDNRIISLENHK